MNPGDRVSLTLGRTTKFAGRRGARWQRDWRKLPGDTGFWVKRRDLEDDHDGERIYEVAWGGEDKPFYGNGVYLGAIYVEDENFWSDQRFHVCGTPIEKTNGGPNMAVRKLGGPGCFKSITAAATYLGIVQSTHVLALLKKVTPQG